jgi:spermidine synthase
MLKKIFSYFLPINIKKYQSSIHGVLEINLNNGKLVLDTEKSNYSYGSLEKILKKGLYALNLSKETKNVLVLGMGGGSIVNTLQNELNLRAKIDLVDFDPQIITIAQTHFHLDKISQVQLIIADASDYLSECSIGYDLIVVDLFIEDIIPKQFLINSFIEQLNKRLNTRGKILYNTIRNTLLKEDFINLQQHFVELGFQITILEKVAGTNDLILATKLT